MGKRGVEWADLPDTGSGRGIYSRLSDWFIKQEGAVSSYELIAREFKTVRDSSDHSKSGSPVTEDDLSHAIAMCRIDLENRYRTTLYNVRGKGYKVTTPDELALYTAKFVKRTILHADRTYRLIEIVDRKKIPGALRVVFLDTEGRIKNLSWKGKKFLKTFVSYLKTEEQKKLEGQPHGTRKEQ